MNIYIGNLSLDTTEDQLRQAFAGYGKVLTVKLITDRDTGRSRGFGFVTFSDARDADDAIDEMNGSELDGRTLTVNEAHDRRPRRDNHDRGNRW